MPFWHCFHTFQVAWKAYLTSLTPCITNPRRLGTPPANSQRTKQFMSCPHGLVQSFRLWSWHDIEPHSLLLVA
jgi:hypothetical protein